LARRGRSGVLPMGKAGPNAKRRPETSSASATVVGHNTPAARAFLAGPTGRGAGRVDEPSSNER